MSTARTRAVVLGASMAGLAAARVLADHFEHVVVVERDMLPDGIEPESRKGVPQGNHAHALLATGERILEGLFPGLMQELAALGASRGDTAGDFLWYQFGGFKLRTDVDLRGTVVGRPCLEGAVRRRVRALDNVTILQEHEGEEPVFDAGRGCVTGLRIKERATAQTSTLAADLVVDASGRGSRSPAWLSAWGYDNVDTSRLEVDLGYTTALFERREGDLQGAIGAVIAGTPPSSKRGAAVFGIEGNRWLITLYGLLGDHAPTDLEGFRGFASSLPTGQVSDLIFDRTPLCPLRRFRFPHSRWLHYERLPRFAPGYLVLGDAICSFSPIYAQGMTLACSEALALDRCLTEGTPNLAASYFSRITPLVKQTWEISTGEDLRFAEIEGPRPFAQPLLHRYLERVHRAAGRDPVVLRQFFRVVNLLEPPTSMLAPKIAWRVLRRGGAHDADA